MMPHLWHTSGENTQTRELKVVIGRRIIRQNFPTTPQQPATPLSSPTEQPLTLNICAISCNGVRGTYWRRSLVSRLVVVGVFGCWADVGKEVFGVFGIFGASRNRLSQGKGGRTETSRTNRFGGNGVSLQLGTQKNVYHTGINPGLGIYGEGGKR